MKFEGILVNDEMKQRLACHGIWLKNNGKGMKKEQALVLLGEAILTRFIEEFVSLWRCELFPGCSMADFMASDGEMSKWVQKVSDVAWNDGISKHSTRNRNALSSIKQGYKGGYGSVKSLDAGLEAWHRQADLGFYQNNAKSGYRRRTYKNYEKVQDVKLQDVKVKDAYKYLQGHNLKKSQTYRLKPKELGGMRSLKELYGGHYK